MNQVHSPDEAKNDQYYSKPMRAQSRQLPPGFVWICTVARHISTVQTPKRSCLEILRPLAKGFCVQELHHEGHQWQKKPRLNSNFFPASKPHKEPYWTTFDWRLLLTTRYLMVSGSAPILSTIRYRSPLNIFQLIFKILFSIVSMLAEFSKVIKEWTRHCHDACLLVIRMQTVREEEN